jgi:hypothetical protein
MSNSHNGNYTNRLTLFDTTINIHTDIHHHTTWWLNVQISVVIICTTSSNICDTMCARNYFYDYLPKGHKLTDNYSKGKFASS